METREEKQILQELYEIDDVEMFVAIMNYYSKIKTIRSKMVDSLNLLDRVAETGNEDDKQQLRKLILDNFNDLPRETQRLISKLSTIKKE